MSTSGSTNFSITRNDIINQSLKIAGILAVGQVASAEDFSDASLRLNLMTKAWMGQGIHLWRYTEAVLFLSADTQSYSLNSSSGDHATTAHIETALDGDHAGGVTALTVDSTTGMTTGDYLGIELADGTRQWTTLTVVSGTALTAGAALTSAASDNAVIYTYTTRAPRPLRIRNARLQQHDSSEIPLDLLSRQEYFDQPSKDSSGRVTSLYYDPQLATSKVKVWPTSDNVNDFIRYTFERTIEDFDSATDNPDFPIEWGEAIIYGLASRLSEYSCPAERRAEIRGQAEMSLSRAMSFDQEDTSVFFKPSRNR